MREEDVGTKEKGYAQGLEEKLSTRWAGHPLYYAEEIDSTNLWAQRLAEEGKPGGTLCVADFQTAGRGSRGRRWEEEPGLSVMMSLLLTPSFPAERASMLTLVMGMAVAGAVQSFGLPATIKWPNDVVVSKKKICGILTEMRLQGSEIRDVVIGVGINVNAREYPPELADKATSLYLEAGHPFSREEVLCKVIEIFEGYEELFEKKADLSLLKDEYESMLANKGAPVRVLSDPPFEGIALGIDERGHLIVKKEDGTLAVVGAGEVSVRGLYSYV